MSHSSSANALTPRNAKAAQKQKQGYLHVVVRVFYRDSSSAWGDMGYHLSWLRLLLILPRQKMVISRCF